MSVFDQIHEAEAQAEQIRGDAKVKARDIIAKAQAEARADGEKKVSAARESYRSQLAELNEQIEQKYSNYLSQKEKDNEKLAQIAQHNLDKAAEYILQQVISQC